MELLPHVALLPDRIVSIAALPDGGYAVGTAQGLFAVDAGLAVGAKLAEGSTLDVLGDGRLLVRGGETRVGRPGALEPLDVGSYSRAAHALADGFVVLGADRLIVEHAGRRATIPLGERYVYLLPWRDTLALADRSGLELLALDGAPRARSAELYLTGEPIAIADVLVVPGLRGLHVFDAAAREVSQHDCETGIVKAFAGGVVVARKLTYVDDPEVTRIQLLGLTAGALGERWSVVAPRTREIHVVGDRLVLFLDDDRAWIVDATGRVIAKLEDVGYVREAAAFEDGIVVLGDARRVWWRPAGTIELVYDGNLGVARTVPVGLATADGEVLQIWRTDVQGPAPVPLTTDLPMHVPIVVDGTRMTIEGTNRFTLRARIHGNVHGISPRYTAWRHQTTRDEAAALVERLLARTFDGPLPVLPALEWRHQREHLVQLPLAQTVDLVGRGLFAPASLDAPLAAFARAIRESFFGELADALGTRGRLLLAAVRARKLQLVPPAPVADSYDYLGSFTTSGALTVADPCYLGKKPAGGLSLTRKVAAVEGLWHAFIGCAKDAAVNRELVCVHESAFDVYASDELGSIGVDAGCAGVFDKACPKPNLDHGAEEGIVAGLGALAYSGHGDGMYPVFVGKRSGKIVKVRIAFLADAHAVDRLIARASAGTAKPYSATARFALGDAIAHTKFGTGTVVRVGADGKIDVRFDDATRTLVHAKK